MLFFVFESLAHFGGSFCNEIALLYPICLQRCFQQELTGSSRVVYFKICFEMCVIFLNFNVFTDSRARNVKYFCPSERTVKILLGSGQEGTSDGTDQTCSFTQVHGICSIKQDSCGVGYGCRNCQTSIGT